MEAGSTWSRITPAGKQRSACGTQCDGRAGPNHSVRLSPILPKIEVNQVTTMVGRGYGAEGTACMEHRSERK